MKGITKLVLVGGLAATLALGTITPAYAAPADDAAKIASLIAKGLKGLGGMDARARARLLAAALHANGKLRGLAIGEKASVIAQAIYNASNEYGLGITPRQAADSTRIVIGTLPDGTVIAIVTTDGGTASFTVTADGGALTGEDPAVSAG